MASATSNSTASSYATAFQNLFDAASLLEEWQSAISQRVSVAGSEASFEPARSQVTVNSVRSQVTVQGSFKIPEVTPQEGTARAEKEKDDDTPPSYGGMQKDEEGKETRKEMLARRRKECSVEEVDVALAPVMKIDVPFCFYPEQYKRFRKLFPRVNVDSGLSYTHHDHPVAHAATMVGIRRIQGMLAPGQLVLDLHGNPNGNEQFNRFQSSRLRKRKNLPEPPIIHTLVEMKSAADAVRRVTKWGAKEDKETKEVRYYEMGLADIKPGLYDVFLSMHTLYYYTMYEVNALLAKNPQAKIIALVNYTPDTQGSLYDELKYSKNDGITVQTSPNGEKYQHPDIDKWFQTNSFRGLTQTIDCGISWTSTCLGGPLYAITITRCDWGLARHTTYEPPGQPTLKLSRGRCFFGIVRVGGVDVRLNISNYDLASELRQFMTFRDRNNPDTFLDLCVKARRLTGKEQTIEGMRQYKVNDGELQDHIIYAFVVDAPGELELMEGVRLLKGDLLQPLADALKLKGDDTVTGVIQAFLNVFVGRKVKDPALRSRTKPNRTERTPNTGGLLPITRT
jgi:hypothetical protein